MTTTPLCPITISVAYDVDQKLIIEGAPCVGSACAAWRPNSVVDTGHPTARGRCGLATSIGQQFDDPAQPPKAMP